MLLTLLVWIYISFVCLAWGNWILRLTRTVTSVAGTGSLFISMFTGLAVIGILGLYLSLFISLSFAAHLVILLPAISFYLFPANRQVLKEQWGECKANFSLPVFLLAALGLVVMLSLSTYDIIHPDTLRYHGQAIKWMEEYPIVPGTAWVDIHLGLQSWWFAVMALFRFSWVASNPYLFVNGCVAVWFIFFVASRLGKSRKSGNQQQFESWAALLVFCLLSWTQLRLTAASASPDFIAALYTWGAIYLYVNESRSGRERSFILPFFFCCAAFGIKLSAAPIMLLALVLLIMLARRKRTRIVFSLVLSGLVLVAPVIARNIVSSGYPLFPTVLGDWFTTEWKLPVKDLVQWQQYITTYARQGEDSYDAAGKLLQLPFSSWFSKWVFSISPADLVLLICISFLFLYNLVTAKKQWKQCDLTRKIVFLVSFAGTVSWFINAPDPRFGTAFLVPLFYSLHAGYNNGNSTVASFRHAITEALNKVIIWGLCVAMMGYIAYRLYNFCDSRQLITPKGIEKKPYIETSCQGIDVTLPGDGDNCGMAPLPCLKRPCDSIRIIDMHSGFRRK